MNTFYIHEANMPRLEKKIATIQKKCNKHQFSFHYKEVGEEFRDVELEDGTTYTARYVIVEVEGEVKHNGWRFVATLDHHDAGNVIRAFDTEIAIPERYRNCGPTCEHCNKIRSRKDTYIVYNDETDEFKQVGKSCLAEFTNGLDAEQAAWLVSIYEKMEESGSYGGSSYNRYFNIREFLQYAWECYHHFGYEKSTWDEYSDESRPTRTTRSRVSEYHDMLTGHTGWYTQEAKRMLQDEIDQVGFNPECEYALSKTEESLAWIRSVEDINSDYIRNLNILCSEDYSEWKNLGLIVSLTTAYMHELEHREYIDKKNKEHEAQKAAESVSEFKGEVGERITVPCQSFQCISNWETLYGTTFLYKFIDIDGNIFVWYASKHIDDAEKVTAVTGSVKEHSTFRDAKQTILTRCKVAY